MAMEPTAEARPAREQPHGLIQVSAWAGIAGPVLFTASFLVQEAFRQEEYSPLKEQVSALEAGPNGWIQQVTFLVLGVLTLLHAVGLHRGMPASRAGVIGPALLFLTGIGAIIAGIFPLREDAAGETYDPGGHIVGGAMFFVLSPIALVFLSWRMRNGAHWRQLSAYTLVCGVVMLLMAVGMNLLVIPDSAPLHDWAGLAQRIVVLVVLFPCRIAIAVRLLGVAGSGGEEGA